MIAAIQVGAVCACVCVRGVLEAASELVCWAEDLHYTCPSASWTPLMEGQLLSFAGHLEIFRRYVKVELCVRIALGSKLHHRAVL